MFLIAPSPKSWHAEMSSPSSKTSPEVPIAGGGEAASSAVVRSALWAAWGDAVGFPLELRGSRDASPEMASGQVTRAAAWNRRVGGRFGPTVELPAGTYSDDTQLRLAVCRCIRASGRFDLEAFSKIELPVFLSYGLGAGRGTRAAAQGLKRRSVRWSTNFYDERGVRYVDGGGNGAAMRIQPHVWAARGSGPDRYLPGCLRDAVTTHGHPRGILGAALHALALGSALRDSELPAPSRWRDMARYLERVPGLMGDDEELADRWLPARERATGQDWQQAVGTAVEELEGQLAQAARFAEGGDDGSPAVVYARLAQELGGLDPATRGAGTVSAVLSMWLAWVSRDDPAGGVLTAAALSGSDTDTVATMVGALLGTRASDEPPGPLLDDELHRREAERLDRVSRAEVVDDFPHPDPLRWQPPRTLSDAVGTTDDGLAVAGLGPAVEQGPVERGQHTEQVGWQWLLTGYGQTLLVKRRLELQPVPGYAAGRPRVARATDLKAQRELFHSLPTEQSQELPAAVEDGVALLVRQRFERVLMARLLVHYASGAEGVDKAASFGRLVAQAWRSSSDRAPGRAGSEPAGARRAQRPGVHSQPGSRP